MSEQERWGEFDRRLEAMLSSQAVHEERINALLRIAESHQGKIDRLDNAMASLAESMIDLREAERRADERVASLVSAIGEYIRQRPQGSGT